MAESGLYIYAASLVGAVALYLLMAGRNRSIRLAAGVVGLGVFGYLVQGSVAVLATTPEQGTHLLYLVFSVIAIASATRMITHHRPVYSALYFVLTVISSAALFLLLHAEFMAFALIIVYAGAILVTYMFVLMFAQQSPRPPEHEDEEQGVPVYDRVPREPAAAAAVGFILLALLANTSLYGPREVQVASSGRAEANLWETVRLMPRQQVQVIRSIGGQFADIEIDDIVSFNDPPRQAEIRVGPPVADGSPARTILVNLPDDQLPSNIRTVGMDLVYKFPVSLELAGVILLLAMFGAVVLARRQIELGEDEKREAAGLRRLGVDDDNVAPDGREGGDQR